MFRACSIGAAGLLCLLLGSPSFAQIGQPEPPFEGPGCPRDGTVSPQSSARATLTIHNPSRRKMFLYWVDFDGSSVLYAEMQGKTKYTINTFVGHVWIMAGPSGSTCETVIKIPRGNPEYTF